MSPTIVLKDEDVFLVTGSPGGSKIINTVLQVILNIIEFDMNPSEATLAARFHHQWLPDVLDLEHGFQEDTRNLLEEMGYKVNVSDAMGNAQTIVIEDEIMKAAADLRRPGGKAIGF